MNFESRFSNSRDQRASRLGSSGSTSGRSKSSVSIGVSQGSSVPPFTATRTPQALDEVTVSHEVVTREELARAAEKPVVFAIARQESRFSADIVSSAGAVGLMRNIKHALDPKNIMNPGKIFAI